MLSSKTDRYGRRIQGRGNAALSHDAVKLLKTQDAGYLKTVIQQTRRIVEKVEQSFHLVNEEGVRVAGNGDEVKSGQHIFFADSMEEQQARASALKKKDSSVEDDPEQSSHGGDTQKRRRVLTSMDPRRVARAKEEMLEAMKQERAVRKLRKRQRAGQQSMLKALKAREKDLCAAEEQLDHARARMSHSVGGVNKAGVKWKIRERKR